MRAGELGSAKGRGLRDEAFSTPSTRHGRMAIDLETGWTVTQRTYLDDLEREVLEQTIESSGGGIRYTRTALASGDNLRVAAWVDLITLAQRPTWRSPDPFFRRAVRVLAMVGELHKLGFQGLRIFPGLSSSGAYWRCMIVPRSQVLRKHGAWAAEWDWHAPFYTSGSDNEYFGWTDATKDSARDLARKFLERFPHVAERGRHRDLEYAGWYVEMLGLAEYGALPIAYADYQEPDQEWLHSSRPGTRIPMPPGGDAVPIDDPFPNWR